MTNQQTGREAFEALVEKWRDAARGIRPSGTWNGNDLAERYEWCADELEAALAQQGREVGEAVAWHPVIAELHAHMRHCLSAADEGVDYAVSREMLDAMTTLRLMEKCGRGKWRPTEYGESFVYGAPKQQAVEVTEDMVGALVSAANATLAANPHDDTMWTLEAAVAPFNATKPAECENGCPPQQVCDYCQIAARYTAALPDKTEVGRG